jgi:hypothetical protein
MSQINVTPGQRVGAGATLGITGLTGFTTGITCTSKSLQRRIREPPT